ncbi:MAG: PIN domain-containing protein [Leptolyngbyaceae cyanobacterium SL_5_9]|nr:PIN domain-containing protein [Leptolyngbyaceae cyanobacterium SL_5_9]NJO76872.1 PIN domain-containing protein [Leptolyngbyaceae cyanobacterium RM1_406_9]
MKGMIADTGPLYATIDPDDQYHDQAQSELKRIETDKLFVIVPIPVYLETYSLLLYRLGFSQALRFARECNDVACLVSPSLKHYQTAVAKVAQFPDQRITLADAVIAVLAAERALPVWTYDYHFDVMRVQVWR